VLHCGSKCSLSQAMDGRIMRHGIISSWQSAATSEIVKRCCSSLVNSAIASTRTFTFTFTIVFDVLPVLYVIGGTVPCNYITSSTPSDASEAQK